MDFREASCGACAPRC